MRRKVIALTAAVSIASLAFAVAASASGTAPGSSYSTGFEPSQGFTVGSVDGQGGAASWSARLSQSGGGPPFDQAVTNVNPITGLQSFRLSNAVATGEFENQTHAPTLENGASERGPDHVFDATFKVKSTSLAEQPGLAVSVSPDDGHGGRQSYVRFDDKPDGIHVFVVDNPLDADQRVVEWGTVLSRATSHTVRFRIQFVPGVNDDGTGNDIVRVIVDGHDVGDETHTCFTSWEQWYHFGENREPPITNSLTFMARGASVPTVAGGGYLFDDVSYSASDSGGPTRGNCGIDVGKTTATRVARPGQRITYRITVRNRSKLPARRLQACDRPPRALTFLRASVRLHRAAGRRLCATIPLLRPGQRKTFRVTFRVGAHVTAKTVTNGGSVDIPSAGPPPSDPAGSRPPVVPPNVRANERLRRVVRTRVRVRIRHRLPSQPPPVTG